MSDAKSASQGQGVEPEDYDDGGGCQECGDGENPDSLKSACIDDLCHGGDVPCMHGEWDALPCGTCGK